MKRQFRFWVKDEKWNRWTRWYREDEDLSYIAGEMLDVQGIEVSEEMTVEEFQRKFPGILRGVR